MLKIKRYLTFPKTFKFNFILNLVDVIIDSSKMFLRCSNAKSSYATVLERLENLGSSTAYHLYVLETEVNLILATENWNQNGNRLSL